MPTSPVKTRIPLSSFGHLITEVKVWTEINLCMSSCRDAIIDALIKKGDVLYKCSPLRMMDYSPPNSCAICNKCSGVLRETCKSVQSFSNNSVTIQRDQNSCAGILDEENVSSVIAIYHEQWLLFLCYLSYISRFKMYVSDRLWSRMHLRWHCFDKLLSCCFSWFLSCLAFIFHQDSCIAEGWVWPLHKASPAHPKGSQWGEGLDSGGGSMCETDVSCSLNHSLIIWAWTHQTTWPYWIAPLPDLSAPQQIGAILSQLSSPLCGFL